MNRFKYAALTLAATGLLSMQAHAAEVQQENSQTLPVAAFSQADIDAMFVQTDKPMQLAVLSQQEMKETEGAWVPIVVGGVAGGLYNGISYYNNASNYTAGGWATAIGSGVVGGAVGGVSWWSAPIWGGGIAAAGGWAANNLR